MAICPCRCLKSSLQVQVWLSSPANRAKGVTEPRYCRPRSLCGAIAPFQQVDTLAADHAVVGPTRRPGRSGFALQKPGRCHRAPGVARNVSIGTERSIYLEESVLQVVVAAGVLSGQHVKLQDGYATTPQGAWSARPSQRCRCRTRPRPARDARAQAGSRAAAPVIPSGGPDRRRRHDRSQGGGRRSRSRAGTG